jgi:hypothetical protein
MRCGDLPAFIFADTPMSFRDYDEKLNDPIDDEEIWFDSEIFVDLLIHFTENDWQCLKMGLFKKAQTWQGRCVATLSAGDLDHGVEILIEYISREIWRLQQAPAIPSVVFFSGTGWYCRFRHLYMRE